jgi:hypothetical protein
MKRLIFFLFLIFMFKNANADWILETSSDKVDFYIDSSTIVRNKNIVKMWSLQNFKTKLMLGDISVLSSKDYAEYDCKNKTINLIKSILYTENMGRGEVAMIFELDPSEQKKIAIPSDTIGLIKLSSVCTE